MVGTIRKVGYSNLGRLLPGRKEGRKEGRKDGRHHLHAAFVSRENGIATELHKLAHPLQQKLDSVKMLCS